MWREELKVTSYGLFWRVSEIDWFPGGRSRNSLRLLGRTGSRTGKIKVADFRHQQGIYILYDEYGPSYVGLTKRQGLGKRLKDHLEDQLQDKWDRFSWFGFHPIGAPAPDGVLQLDRPLSEVSEDTDTTIGELGAVLIRAIGPRHNTSKMNFKAASRWVQIEEDDVEKYLAKLKRGISAQPTSWPCRFQS